MSGEHREDATVSRARETAEAAAAACRRLRERAAGSGRAAGRAGAAVMMANRASRHEESWLLLPWLANGRLSLAERAALEEHLRECAACTQELAQQRLMCQVLTEPERVTYAPGPSLRKLMERIDGHTPARPQERPVSRRSAPAALAAAWRPPGLAWAASFVLAIGLAAFWWQPRYTTHTELTRATP